MPRRSSRYRSQRPEDIAAANRWTAEMLRPSAPKADGCQHEFGFIYGMDSVKCVLCGQPPQPPKVTP